MAHTATHDITEALDIPGVEILEEIGRGAHSIVYRGRLDATPCAVKVRRGAGQDDIRHRTLRFRREAAVLARFDHPGLVRIIEAGETDGEGRPYLITEYVDGPTLAEILHTRGALDEEGIVAIASMVASALSEVHRHGLVHRDVKPGNILVRAEDQAVRLIDFGFAARARHTSNDPGHADKAVVGTLRYAAPEQAGMLQRPVDARSDLYSLGVVLYECATGEPPFASEEPAELVRQHAVDRPVPVRQKSGDVGEVLSRIIDKLLAKDPDDRYPSAAALVADLEAIEDLEKAYADGASMRLGRRRMRATNYPAAPLIGRHREYSRLESAWLAARSGRGSICWISGEPGSGTTRLVEELICRGNQEGALVLTVRCSRTDSSPFSAIRQAGQNFVDQLRSHDSDLAARCMAHIEDASQEQIPVLARLTADAADLPDTARRFVAEDGGSPTRFAESVASFFLQLATADWPVMFVVDEVHHIDDASRQVMRHLCHRLESRHFLLACTIHEGFDQDARPEAFFGHLDDVPIGRLRLGPLDEEAVAELVTNELGGRSLPAAVVRQIAARTQGVPVAVREYVFAMLEAGLLQPVRDGWRVDAGGLASLELPENLTDLMVRRLEDIDDKPRAILREAAVEGHRFNLEHLYEYSRGGRAAVSEAVGRAAELRLVEHLHGDVYAFVHQRIRRALLGEWDAVERRAVHQRVAEALDDPQADADDHVFAVARHYARGDVQDNRQRVFETNLQAGLLALRENAFEEAYAFLTTAKRHGRDSELASGRIAQAIAEAAASTGRVGEAIEQLQQAVTAADSDLERARLQARLCRVHMAALEMDEAWAKIVEGCNTLELAVPGHTFASGLGTLFAFLYAWLVARVPTRNNAAPDSASAQMRLRADLYETGAITAFFRLDNDLMGALIARALRVARGLPDCGEKARVYASYAAVLAILGRGRAARAYATDAIAIAETLDDPAVLARVRWFEATTHEFLGEAARAELLLRRTIKDLGLWLELWEYVTVCGELGGLLLDRGYVRQAGMWGERILERTRQSHDRSEVVHMERVYGLYLLACSRAWMGQGLEARSYVDQARQLFEGRTAVGLGEASAIGYELAVHYEVGDRGEDVERLLSRWSELGLNADRLPHQLRRFYVYQAYVRLDQYRWARDFERSAARTRFLDALEQLKVVADTPKHLAHLCVISADWEAFQGDEERQRALLGRADQYADEADSPWGRFEVELRRARRLKQQGHLAAAKRRARWAHDVAQEYGWSSRARDVRTEFAFRVEHASATVTRSGARARPRSARSARSGSEGSTNAQSLKLQRYLDSLLEVSVASATVFDPQEQARVALDEIVRIFGAERAFLFGIDESKGLEMIAGRDVRGHDLTDRGDYSSSVIERVYREQKAVVSTGSDEEDVLAHASAVHHNLRSIMAGPVQIQDRFLGVVYVDSRLARGVFARDDAEILMAISSHIAISQETARAAQLEVDVESERKKRELAEVIRQTTTAVSATFDLTEILGRLLEGVGRLVEADRAVAFLLEDAALELFVEKTASGTRVGDASEWVFGDPRIERVLDTAQPHVAGEEADLGGAFSSVDSRQSWLGVPIVARSELAGMMLLESDTADAYGRDHVQVALALAGQAGIAIENARLFEKVERLAIIDELTQLPNRRRLFEVAEQEFERARRYDHRLALIMLDIDHFKPINDTYGHVIGDVVLREVARRCADVLRQSDTIGRYGGEEFVVIMPETGLSTACEQVAERLRTTIADSPFETDAGPLEVTVSVGVAELASFDEGVDGLLQRADEALYAAKDAGRNRVRRAQT